jgi:predicted RNA-binding protein with EMAP domain
MITIVLEPEKYLDLMDALAIADKVQNILSEHNDKEYDDKFKKLMDEIDFFKDNLNQ